jgi:actin related protein 2/3 complex subunit 1A/1B
MSAPEVFQLSVGPLTGVAFGPDRTQLAVSPNNNQVQIYRRGASEWDAQTTLSEHDKLITAISWAPQTNRIVTCSQDRNAYVWTPTASGELKPTLVLLRLNRAATCVKWSPLENKFAVGSGAR